MSDDETDPELLELLRISLMKKANQQNECSIAEQTGVLKSAEFIYDNAIDVALERERIVQAAHSIWKDMEDRSYSANNWSCHELHPKTKDESTLNFIFTLDLLNFSFWSALPENKRYSVWYRNKNWTGYWGLVACIQRALDEEIPITTPKFWLSNHESLAIDPGNDSPGNDRKDGNSTEFITLDVFKHIFRGNGEESMPLLEERFQILREASRILFTEFDGSVVTLVESANKNAARLVNQLVHRFASCFDDQAIFQAKKVKFYKRAQIFVADIWAAFEGKDLGEFHDIDCITMFADYRVAQQLHSLGCLRYSPTLEHTIRSEKEIVSGSTWECEIRGCSIWTVELIRRQIVRLYPDSTNKVNAILIDFYLYDLAKEKQVEREKDEIENSDGCGEEKSLILPHHRTRSIWY